MSEKLQNHMGNVVFLSHGGGPLPLLGDKRHEKLVTFLEKLVSTIARPSAILIISAHWEGPVASITSGKSPPLLYDYSGFPKESYEITYPAPGHPDLARTVFSLLDNKDITAKLDERRGFDHGVFVPLKIMYPQADIPCVQLSLLQNLNPKDHIRIGQALSSLRDTSLLIIGSGSSFHNLPAFFTIPTGKDSYLNKCFERWLIDTCTSMQYTNDRRNARLIEWEKAPGARFCHPREEHLLPLHVCCGVTGTPAKHVFEIEMMGRMTSAFLW